MHDVTACGILCPCPTLTCPSSFLHRRIVVASVKILGQTYTLPAIATKRFRALQYQVRDQQRVIQTGLRPQERLLGIIPLRPRTLKPEERWQELDLLVRNYDAIIAELSASKEAYEAFFGILTACTTVQYLRL